MDWHELRVHQNGTHHINPRGDSAYAERFDEVLKFHAPGLAPVRRGYEAWHIGGDGKAAYVQRFVRTFGFYENMAAVIGRNGWHHISSDGADAYRARYAWCGNFQEARCTVRTSDGGYHHIKHDASAAYPVIWRYAGDYRDGIAVVQATDGRLTHIDREGNFIHGNWFIDLDIFHKGFARGRDEDGWTHIDIRGRPIYTRRFSSIEPFYNGQARVERFDGALDVIDEAGTTLVELRPPRQSEFAALSADMVGFWRTQTISAAVQLDVIEVLPATETEVAVRCALGHDGARRLLRALGELGLATLNGGRWCLTSRGEFLRAEHPLTLADAALEYAGPFSKAWSLLPHALRSNSDWTAPDVFGEVGRDDARRPGHHRMLQSYARHDYADVCGVIDLRDAERVIDAGGGLGVLGRLIISAYPSVKVTVLERPEVVALAYPSNPGLQWCGANLLEPWGLEADVVLLSRVLHDWCDVTACKILQHARAALPVGGRLYIIEMLLSQGGVAGALCDLHLLTATGGRERSAEEFGRLLEMTGFRLEEVRTVPALPSVVLGVAL
jgi:hypothetical protein